MIDWFVLLAPLLLAPTILLLVFAGCALDRSGGGLNVTFVTIFPPTLGGGAEQFNVIIDLAELGGDDRISRAHVGTPEIRVEDGRFQLEFEAAVPLDKDFGITYQLFPHIDGVMTSPIVGPDMFRWNTRGIDSGSRACRAEFVTTRGGIGDTTFSGCVL